MTRVQENTWPSWATSTGTSTLSMSGDVGVTGRAHLSKYLSMSSAYATMVDTKVESGPPRLCRAHIRVRSSAYLERLTRNVCVGGGDGVLSSNTLRKCSPLPLVAPGR